MSLVPEFKIGLWNGWILSAIFQIVNYFIMITGPKENVKETMDEVKQIKGREKVVYSLSMVVNLGIMLYSIFVPLKTGTPWFYIGLVIFVIGEIGEIIIGVQWSHRKPGQPLFKGFYCISRNPTYVFFYIIFIGIGVATASWLIQVFTVLFIVLNHNRVLGEEHSCLEKYGNVYREYMKKTPRYFLFFKKRRKKCKMKKE